MHSHLLGTDPTSVTGSGALVVLTRAALRVAGPLAVVLVVGSFALRGPAGGVTALASAVVLLGLHVGSGRLSARIGRGNPNLLPALTMLGLIVRLGVYGALIAIFGDVAGVDVPVLAATVIGLTVVILVVETIVVARYSKFWWQPQAAAPSAAPEAATPAAPEADAPAPAADSAPAIAGKDRT